MKSLIYSKPKILINCKAKLGEGPFWNHNTLELSFVDILSKKFFIWKKNILKILFFKKSKQVRTSLYYNYVFTFIGNNIC